MIDVLKSGKLNNRLLCELVTHEGFRRFLVDMEIFVDRIADMRINDMNTMLEVTRQAILERQGVGEDDLHVRTLELAQVGEEDYFSYVMQRDLDAITHDIREQHQRDRTTADTVPPPPTRWRGWKKHWILKAARRRRKQTSFPQSLTLTMTS